MFIKLKVDSWTVTLPACKSVETQTTDEPNGTVVSINQRHFKPQVCH